MRLLKFIHSDAPHTLADVQLRDHRMWLPGKRGTAAGAAVKSWSLDTTAAASFSGGYWLLDDANNPICEITDVLLAVPESTGSGGGSGGSGEDARHRSFFRPQGVAEEDVEGVDFRSKIGRQVERERASYGVTSKKANKMLRTMINAEEMTEKKYERVKREREAVAEAIENGVMEVNGGSKKGAKRAKPQ